MKTKQQLIDDAVGIAAAQGIPMALSWLADQVELMCAGYVRPGHRTFFATPAQQASVDASIRAVEEAIAKRAESRDRRREDRPYHGDDRRNGDRRRNER